MAVSAREFNRPLAVAPAHGASVTFNVASPNDAALLVEHLSADELLARELRPLEVGTSALEVKTHPKASHIRCSLTVGDQPIDGVHFSVNCNRRIEPAARYFIAIGAMKSGTTTLFELLSQHPALCRTWVEVPGISSTKEINYFRHLYRKRDTPLHYDWRFPFDSSRHAWTLDVSPSYAKWPASKAVPARIASLGGETKLAYILRDPVDRIESHIAHHLATRGKPPSLDHCIRTSQYAAQLDCFMAHIKKEDVLLLDFERLQRNPAAILTQICDFLEIERIVTRTTIHNQRAVRFRLGAKERAELAEALRPDVQRLIAEYEFGPAARWLRKSTLSWIRLPRFRPPAVF